MAYRKKEGHYQVRFMVTVHHTCAHTTHAHAKHETRDTPIQTHTHTQAHTSTHKHTNSQVKGKFKTPWPMTLGSWWVEAAVRGAMAKLPVVTVKEAEEVAVEKAEEKSAAPTEGEFCWLEGASCASQEELDNQSATTGLVGQSMADGGAPPKRLLDEIKEAGRAP